MKLWTHHPSNFRVGHPKLKIVPTKGLYWDDNTIRYPESLQKLWDILGERQFLWCCTVQGIFKRYSENQDLVEWELNVPDSQILRYYDERVWEEILRNPNEGWDRLLLSDTPKVGMKGIGAFVKVPLQPGWVTCNGQLPLHNQRHLEMLAKATE